MKKSIFLLLPFFASAVIAQGQSSGLGSLKLPSHAREAALAAATVADPSSPSSFLLNPALLEYSQSPEFAVSHQEWIEDVQSNSLMTVIPVSFGVFGFSVSSTSVGGIELRDRPGPPRGTFNSRYATAGISAAAAFGQSVRAGVSVKYLYEKIFVDEADGWGVDLGLAYQTEIEGLSFGASLLNMGSMGELRSSSTRLPTSLLAGAAFQTGIHEKVTLRAMTSFQRYLAISSTHASIGLELDYSRSFLARAGYQTGYSTRGISAGIGIVTLPFLLDYSFTPFSFSLGNAHLLSLGIRL